MNNGVIINHPFEEQKIDSSPLLRKRSQDVTDIIEALQNILNSSYWKVLQQHIFSVEYEKARKSLVREDDTTELFRLQGELRSLERFSLEKLLEKHRNELEIIKKKINE